MKKKLKKYIKENLKENKKREEGVLSKLKAFFVEEYYVDINEFI